MNEVFPVLFGCGLGLLCGYVSVGRARCFCWVGLSAIFGLAATVGTGEWRSGWEFLFIDISAVAVSSFAMIVLRNTTGQVTASSLRL